MRRDVEKVQVDSRETCDRLRSFAAQYMPGLAEKIEHYTGARPIFDLYGVEDEIQRALEKEVPLKSGGYLVIDQTEAMTTVDVNTGSFLGQRNLEETVYRTNLEAAQAVARQLRLRNLGGIIIIDFIDMTDAEHQPPGAAHAREVARPRPRQDDGLRLLAARPGRDDAQAHHRKPRTPAVRAVPRVRRARHAEDVRDGDLRNLPRDHARGAPVRSRRACW